ncbi:YSIRK signal domain/LPXTG anchor domain surface protein, partial [Limosilactobacillus reuteri]|nr:YSIRK signal domain/LPXTG anchor domain surface protein [Limosilactobacillus reuteri]
MPVAVNGGGDITIIDDKGHTFSLHANDVVTHKTSDKNIIGGPVIESFKLSYYQGGQNYSKPYIYTLNADKTAYVLTQTGDNPAGVTVKAPQSINASDIKINWTADGTVLFNNALGAIKGNGQPSSLASDNNGGTGTIEYTNWKNNQFGYPKYSAVVDSSSVIWPIYGKGPVSTYPFPSVYIYGAEANGTIPNVNSDVTDLKAALGDASKLVNTSDLTAAHNAKISSIDWQTLPSLDKADAKAPATVRINFTDGSYLDVLVAVNVIKVDQGVDDKTNHDIYRDITRTITIQGETAPVVQHVIYSRAKITDLSKPADQQVTYTDWAPAKNSEGQVVTNFPQYEVTKPGYTATATGATIETIDGKQYVPASGTITEDSANEVVNVTYTANEHTLVINYVDGNGNVVGTYNVPGKTDETVNVDVSGHVPTNWKLVPNQQTISSYKFGSDDPQPVDYKVEHGTEVVPVDKNNKDSYRKITQTIYEIPAGKTDADKKVVRTVSVEFERTGIKDLVTGKTTWNDWNSNSETFPAYNIKEQKGYDSYVNDVKETEVAAVTVNPDSSDITDTITYVKQDATPVPYDPTRDDMSVTRTINYEVPAGYEAIAPVTQTVEYTRDVNGVAGYQDPVTDEITWNPWHVKSGKAEFASASAEQIKGYDSYVNGEKSTEVPAAQVTEKDGVPQNGTNVTVSYQKQGNIPVKWDGTKDNMTMKVTRTINYQVPEGQAAIAPVTQTVDYTREDAQGNAGYTDPATGITTWNAWHVAGDGSAEFPSAQVEQIKGYDSYVNGEKSTEVPAAQVTEKDGVPQNGTNVTVSYQKQGNIPVKWDGTKDNMTMKVTRTINYQVPEGQAAIAPVTQTVDYTREDAQGNAGYTDPATGITTWNAWHVAGNGSAEFPSTQVEQIKGYDSYVDGKKATEVPAAQVTEKDGVPQNGANVTVSYQKQGDTPVPYKPGQDGVNDDMNQYVTRTIVVHEPGKDPVSHDQTVHFTREDAQGNAGYTDPVTGETTWNAWHVAGELNQTNGTWEEFNAPTVKGYTPSQAKVAAEEVTAETKNATVDITYNPVAPTGQNVTTKVGEVPDADQGIANKGDLPDGTKYSWKTTPDVTTDGNKPAVVVVTYPGGSTVEVPVTVTVTKNPTDADKYTPEGQDVNTKTGVVPDPAEGIKNKGDLPDGTKYTWKDTPDVTTAGDKPATIVVTYPDGSKDEVPVTIHVTNPATDADKYTPEGQDVNTKTGVVPDPAEGIKNKGDLPDGTKYTWKDTPDVTTAGDKPATIVVTYPDGSKDEVPVTIHVTNPATDADKYTPEGQDVNTKTGVVPDPAEGIKNKGDLPDGTKYTWKDTPDVTTAGDKPATVVVTYPDGSKDEVPVTIHVTNPATDADKYTPEGQDVNTKTGVVPDPAEGIKNKGDLPDGTKYTWKDTPDVTTAGDKPAT